MAATSPSAVASKASAMPGATTARLVVWEWEMPMNAFMMPHTVPNRPTNGAVAPIVARTPTPRDTCRVIASSTRSSRKPTRSLKPSSMRPPDNSASRAVEAISCATASRASPQFRTASPRLAPLSSTAIRRSARRLADRNSMVLASQTVQVASEAMARPTITAFTTMSALRNMPQGDRFRGNRGFDVSANAACETIESADAKAATFPACKVLLRRRFVLRCCILFFPCVVIWCLELLPKSQLAAKMVIHAGLDFIDGGLESERVAERVHHAQDLAAEVEIIVLELCRPVRAQHVFKAAAGGPSLPGSAG